MTLHRNNLRQDIKKTHKSQISVKKIYLNLFKKRDVNGNYFDLLTKNLKNPLGFAWPPKTCCGRQWTQKHLQVLLPATELIEVYFGYAMRAAFCAPVRGFDGG